MVDPHFKAFLISELKKRGLSIQGTFRVLEQRYQQALIDEEASRTQTYDEETNENPERNAESDVIVSNVENQDNLERNVEQDEVLEHEIGNLFEYDPNNIGTFLQNGNNVPVLEASENAARKSSRLFELNQNLIKPKAVKKTRSKEYKNVFECSSDEESKNISNELKEKASGKGKASKSLRKQKEKTSKSSKRNDSSSDDTVSSSDSEPEYDIQNKIYIGNFPYRYKKQKLIKKFRKYGNVIHSEWPSKGSHGLGFGFVIYEKKEEANLAIRKMNDKSVRDRCIRVEHARKPLIKASKNKKRKDNEKTNKGDKGKEANKENGKITPKKKTEKVTTKRKSN